MRVLDDWILTPSRFAVHEPTATVVVADLHLGYERVRCRGGEAIPFRSLAEELASLGREMQHRNLSRLVIAGDLLEDGRVQREELLAELRAWLDAERVELVGVVPGNHDRGLSKSALPLYPDGIQVGEWRVVHGDGPRPEGRVVQGHEHPCLRWPGGLHAACFLIRDDHLILPAWSPDAAGGNVRGDGRWKGYRALAIVERDILDFGEL